VTWVVLEHPAFSEERQSMPLVAVEKLADAVLTLEAIGPQLARPGQLSTPSRRLGMPG
jgi:hypothetical protein